MKNYEDTKCSWGYITLCDNCVARIKIHLNRAYRHININKEVTGFPIGLKCEKCGKKKK